MYFRSLLITIIMAFVSACGGGDPVVNVVDGVEGNDPTPNETIEEESVIDEINEESNVGRAQLSELSSVLTSLQAGGSTAITTTIIDADNNNEVVDNAAFGVTFGSLCEEAGFATLSRDTTIVSSGSTSVTYSSGTCKSSDTILVQLYELNADGEISPTSSPLDSKSITLSIASPDIGGLSFVEVSSPAISLDGVGNSALGGSTSVSFFIFDENGNPLDGIKVDFSTDQPKVVEFSPSSATSNAEGQAVAVVRGRSVAGQARIIATATLEDETIQVISTPIFVGVGLTSNKNFDIAADVLAPHAFGINGVEVNFSVVAGDYLGNPVPDGTVVNFTVESGVVEPFCETTGGRCSVLWVSGGVRPGNFDERLRRANELDGLGSSIRGLTTVMAYTIGDSDFTDLNSNSLYDDGEPLSTYPEAYRDDDDNGEYDGDANGFFDGMFVDLNSNGQYDAEIPDKYQGILCSDEAKAEGHCASVTHASDYLVFVQSDFKNSPSVIFYDENRSEITGPVNPIATPNIFVAFRDVNGNTLPDGVNVDFTADGYDVSSGIVGGANAVYNGIGGDIPDRALVYRVTFSPEDDGDKDLLEITVSLDNITYTFTKTLTL